MDVISLPLVRCQCICLRYGVMPWGSEEDYAGKRTNSFTKCQGQRDPGKQM